MNNDIYAAAQYWDLGLVIHLQFFSCNSFGFNCFMNLHPQEPELTAKLDSVPALDVGVLKVLLPVVDPGELVVTVI